MRLLAYRLRRLSWDEYSLFFPRGVGGGWRGRMKLSVLDYEELTEIWARICLRSEMETSWSRSIGLLWSFQGWTTVAQDGKNGEAQEKSDRTRESNDATIQKPETETTLLPQIHENLKPPLLAMAV